MSFPEDIRCVTRAVRAGSGAVAILLGGGEKGHASQVSRETGSFFFEGGQTEVF